MTIEVAIRVSMTFTSVEELTTELEAQQDAGAIVMEDGATPDECWGTVTAPDRWWAVYSWCHSTRDGHMTWHNPMQKRC